MKTNSCSRCLILLEAVRRLWPVVVVLVSPLTLAAEAKSAAAEPKTHTLFMGADLSVERNKELCRVVDILDAAFVINVGGREIKVPADWSKVNVKVNRSLKLTDASATVVNLKGERAYTLANDPTVQFQQGIASAALQHSENINAQNEANAGLKGGGMATGHESLPGMLRPEVDKIVQKIQIQTQQSGEQSSLRVAGTPGTTFHNTGSVFDGEGMFDAMDISFEVSAEQPLTNPYVVILGQYREKDGKPGSVANWIYAQPVQPITGQARKIHIVRGGFPRGFEMQEFQVHLYNRGREIATDVSPKRVQLTREEAFMYARIEYQGSHKGATLPAKPFMGKLTPEAGSRLNAAQLEQLYYVKVSKDGLPLLAYLDTNCSRPVDETVRPLIDHVRFFPALENGKAVEGVAELKFARLTL